MKAAFVEKRLSFARFDKINLISQILQEYAKQGYILTVRQIYYQLVARGNIENSIRSYKRVVGLVSDWRLCGYLDWDMVQDRNRETVSVLHWSNPSQILEAAAQSYRIDKWIMQPYHVEVMVEKDALSGILEPICHKLDIACTACKGYNSLSNMYETGRRLAERWYKSGAIPVILYLGDHDPSGIDMTRDVYERLLMFSGVEKLQVRRLALNYSQIAVMKPPKNPAKQTDSRYRKYVEQFGEASWELDAVEPKDLVQLVEEAVLSLRDPDLWNEAVAIENHERQQLAELAQGAE